MSQDETAVNDEVVEQNTTTTESASADNNNSEVVDDDVDTSGYDDDDESLDSLEEESAEPEKSEPKAEEPTEDQEPRGEDKQLSPKAENRFQQLANDNKALREQIAQLEARKQQYATEQELANEINPETGEYYTPQEIERIAWQQSREQQAKQTEEQLYQAQIQQNQQTIASETQRAIQEFPMFDEQSPDYNPALAQHADALLGQALITGQNGEILGANISPYQLIKSLADASQANAAKYEANAQKATQKMLANADTSTNTSQAKTKSAEDDAFDAYDTAI